MVADCDHAVSGEHQHLVYERLTGVIGIPRPKLSRRVDRSSPRDCADRIAPPTFTG